MENLKHTDEVVSIHERILKESTAEGKFIEIDSGRKIHVIEAGNGPPLVMLHGTGAPAHTMLPLVERLKDVRTIVPDLPGSGLSDAVDMGHRSYHDMALEVIDQILDALEVDEITLAGSSGGGVWAIWAALANPQRIQRLILLGSIPLLPRTSPPFPLRLMTAPILGDIMTRVPANEKSVLQLMKIMGEKETITNYPMMVEALAAGNNDPLASYAARREFSAFLNLFGFKASMEIGYDQLAKLKMPTLFIWGERDPLGGEKVARAASEAIPNSELAMLPTGHVPWLGYPDKTAELIFEFMCSAERSLAQ